MENAEEVAVKHPWDQQQELDDDDDDDDDDEQLEESLLLARRKNFIYTPLSTTLSADFTTNNDASVNVTNGQHQKQEQDDDELQVEDLNQENGIIKVDEDEKDKNKIPEYSVYYDTNKDNVLHSELTEDKANGVDTEIAENHQDNGNGVGPIISNRNGKHHNHEIPIEEVNNNVPSYIGKKPEINEIQVIKDGEDEITEFDVETVLKKQDTHDLFCPNCNSCITKRVILRKRKRRIPVPGDDAKRNKSEVNGVLDDTSNIRDRDEVDTSLVEVQPLISHEYDEKREPDVFRCLSCFSIFMPTGNGFKLFQMFGNKKNEVNSERSQNEVPVKKHWFSNFFGSDKMENNVSGLNDSEAVQSLDVKSNMSLSTQEVNTSNTNGTTNSDNNRLQSANSSAGRNENAPSSTQGSDTNEQQFANESDNATESSGMFTMDEQLLTSYHTESNGQSNYPGMFVVKPPLNNVEPTEISVSPFQHDGLKLVVPANVGSLIIDNSQMNQDLDVTVQVNNQDDKGRANLSFSPPASILEESNLGYKIKDLEVSQLHSFQNNVEIYPEEPLKVDNDVLTNKQIDLLEDSKNNAQTKGKDTIITIESKQPEQSALQSSPDAAVQQVVGSGSVTTATEGRGLEIVKSVVYGGLMELIASLSVVSSAVGADAATVNVFALGLANIFGGLFVIIHDLWDLRNERTRKKEDRYQQFLGQRTNFPLHMAVALISYFVFGFLPPLIYGFSFRESNNKDLKLLMVAAASIICIMILAAAKAYVQSPQKSYFKTIAYYFVFGFMVSGVTYLSGELIMKLLEKIDVFHSDTRVNLIIHGANSKPSIATF
ncbi:membrane protein of ER body-like protein isoform X2 [Rutidosis leptorrhynchoides]|uniref:membrane protein of ER body-like protein isoform X2 n=1 Tax=Rutidosis leptorrhynchoides TaxID=125765 RepID=UPI003A99AF0C